MDLNKATDTEKKIEEMTESEDIIVSPYETPWEIACKLINAKRTVRSAITYEKAKAPAFDNEELKRLGEHLVNYCRTEEKEG